MNVLDRPVSRWLAIGLAAAAAAVAIAIAPAAQADSTPVGRLPKGPLATIQTTKGQLVSVALPRPSESSGLVWRMAREYEQFLATAEKWSAVTDAWYTKTRENIVQRWEKAKFRAETRALVRQLRMQHRRLQLIGAELA